MATTSQHRKLLLRPEPPEIEDGYGVSHHFTMDPHGAESMSDDGPGGLVQVASRQCRGWRLQKEAMKCKN